MSRALVVMMAIAFMVAGCSHQPRYLTKDKQVRDIWTAASDKSHLRTIGIGVAPDEFTDTTRRKGMARNAALVSARTEMIAMLKGVRLKGSIDISQLVEQKDQVRQIVNSIISGAEEEQVEFDRNDGCIVVLSIERSKVEQMLKYTARAEATDVDLVSLDQQVRLSTARSHAQRSKLPGMAETE